MSRRRKRQERDGREGGEGERREREEIGDYCLEGQLGWLSMFF